MNERHALFINNLKKSHNLTWEQMAERLDCSAILLRKIAYGKKTLTKDKMIRITLSFKIRLRAMQEYFEKGYTSQPFIEGL